MNPKSRNSPSNLTINIHHFLMMDENFFSMQRKKLKKFILIQQRILNLTVTEIEETSKFLINNQNIKNDDDVYFIIDFMTYACHIRPLNIAFYANVCAWIDLMKSQNIIFQNFHQILSDYIFSHLISYNHMLFLYELIQVGIFDLKETLQKFHDLFDDNPDYNTYKHIILFFGPEMYHFSRNIFTYILDKARFEDAHADLTQLKQVEEFAIRGNTNFEYYRIHGETSLLFNEIMYDNISYLKDCQTLTRYSHPHVYFNRFTFIKNFPSLLIAAAYFDAINCFLYLEEICEAQLQSANDNKSRTIYSTQASYVLAAAIAGGSKRIFAYIIQQPNLNSMTLINQRNSCTKLPNPFEVAIQYHRYEMLDILIESVYPDYPTFALAQSSAEFHNIHFFLKYLYSGIEMNQVNFHQTTILMTAALFGLPEMVNLILSFPSCQILQTDDEGKNALYHAVSSKNIAKVKILFKAYCNSNKYNFIHKVHRNAKIEKHLLFQAARVGTSEILDYLLTETGYSPNIRDKFNHTLLHEACFFANIDTIRHLLTLKNIDIHAKTNSKQTAFFKACKKSSLTAIQLLLGANDKSINIRNRKLNLPIHCVAENGTPGVVKLITTHSLHLIDEVNNDGDTPIDIAYNSGNRFSIEILEINGAIFQDDYDSDFNSESW